MVKTAREELDVETQCLNLASHIVNSFYSSTWRGIALQSELQSPIELPDGRLLIVEDWSGKREDADFSTEAPSPHFTETKHLIERMLQTAKGFSMVTGSAEATRAVCFRIESLDTIPDAEEGAVQSVVARVKSLFTRRAV